ncbi:MAG TPA: ParB/RepB/Spo0J family partition protein [Microthrixaceae bacterium]|nr:ParB/RepB/Spo0J family partition protein [Microthrixaceae bacterium]
MARRSGLGKGLGALIPTEASGTTGEGSGLRELPISQISANRFQPRDHFDEESLVSLTESIRTLGVLQAILVRPSDDGYELIAGERRWRAAKRAGLQTIPAVVRASTDDVSSLEQALVENLHRQDLSPLEEAGAFQQLMEDFSFTQEQVAARVGKSRSAVANMIRLFQLPPAVQKLVGERQISLGHAKVLLSTPDRAYQEALARRIVAEELSVRQVEDLVRERQELEDQLGGSSAPRRDPSPKSLRQPGLLELEQLLSDQLSTKVRVEMSTKRGRVLIEFANLEDLERIYRVISDA